MDEAEPERRSAALGDRRRGGRARRLTLAPALRGGASSSSRPSPSILVSSFFRRGSFGGIVYELTLGNFGRAVDPLYLGVLWYSVQIAIITTRHLLPDRLPAAYFIATGGPHGYGRRCSSWSSCRS